MPRTINSTLAEILLSGSYEIYLRAFTDENNTAPLANELEEIISYKLTKDTLEIKATSSYIEDQYFVQLRRGVTKNGATYYIDTSVFQITNIKNDGIYVEITANLHDKRINIGANKTYETFLDELCTSIEKIAVFKDPTATFWQNTFLPPDKYVTLDKSSSLKNLLKQRYFMSQADNSNEEIIFYCLRNTQEGTDYTITVEKPITISQELGATDISFSCLSYDENGDFHSDSTRNLYNIGYLQLGDVKPNTSGDTGQNYPQIIEPINLPMNLTYLSGDVVTITSSYNSISKTGILEVVEYLDTKKDIAWGIFISFWDFIGTVEGGNLPRKQVNLTNYSPIQTGNFTNNLNINITNIQALADAVDQLTTGASNEQIQDIVGAMTTSNTETGITVTYQDTDGTIDFELDSDLTAIANLSPANDDIIQRKSGAWTNRTLAEIATDLTELIQDIVGAMFTGNTETGITVTYQDSDGTIDVVENETGRVQVLFFHSGASTIAASTTRYLYPGRDGLQSVHSGNTFPIPAKVRNLYFRSNTSQPATGSLVCTVQKNLVDTTLQATVAAGAGATTATDLVDQITFAAGDVLTIKIQNNATSASAQITYTTLEIVFDP